MNQSTQLKVRSPAGQSVPWMVWGSVYPARKQTGISFSSKVFIDVKTESLPWHSETNRPLPQACREVSRLDQSRADLATIARIRALSDYTAGWDGHGAAEPTPQALFDAESFVRRLPLDRIHSPHVSLAADGEVNFLWILPAVRLDLGFYGDGFYSFYALTAKGREFTADETPVSQSLPGELLALLEHPGMPSAR